VIDDNFFDHLPNRKRFPLIAPAVLRLEPIETTIGIVRPLLLWQKQRKTVTVREGRPPSPKIVSGCALSASMQYDDKCAIVRKGRWSIAEHSQIAGVRSEIEDLAQTCADLPCTSRVTAIERSKELLPTASAAAEAQCMSQIYHDGSFPCFQEQLIAALHNARGSAEICAEINWIGLATTGRAVMSALGHKRTFGKAVTLCRLSDHRT
jgi:hypothetical protein